MLHATLSVSKQNVLEKNSFENIKTAFWPHGTPNILKNQIF